MLFTTSTRYCLVVSAGLTLLGCSSNPDGSNAGTGGAANGGAANGGSSGAANGGSASGGAPSGGSSGAATGGNASGGAAADGPASASKADIGAFLDKAGYKASPWISDVSTPRKATTGSQHGDGIRVWENPTLVTSIKAGRDGWDGRPLPDVGSMAVKEMYDDTGTLVGLAAALRTTAGTGWDSWTYYCYAPGTRCSSNNSGTKEAPIYGDGWQNPTMPCAICHGSTIFTVPP